MKKILTVVGARPQFIKCAPVSRALRESFTEILVHTGQHYDPNMSESFFKELDIPAPDIHLGVGSGHHGEQTAKMLVELEQAMLEHKPDVVLVYGDTNSTLAAAVAAAKLCIPIAHVEAGLRSFNKKMPEELNRIATDHFSTLLFCPTDTAVENLKNENIRAGVYNTGDVMMDAVLYYSKRGNLQEIFSKYGINQSKSYFFFTLHRAENTDNPNLLKNILATVGNCGFPTIFPIHPRTKAALEKNSIALPQNVIATEPTGYIESLLLQKHASVVVTDSGGLQKEAYMLDVPCITLRNETEWVETVQDGWNVTVGSDPQLFRKALEKFQNQLMPKKKDHYGNGTASNKILQLLKDFCDIV